MIRIERAGKDVRVLFEPEAFSTVEDCVAHARFSEAVLGNVVAGLEDRLATMDRTLAIWVMAAAQRATGLHVALVRETSWDNMHASFALLRAYVDTVLVTAQVAADPSYVEAVIHDPSVDVRGRRRMRPQALVARAKRLMPGMREAWDYLSSSGGHFGWAAFQTSFTAAPGVAGEVNVRITTGPGWRDPAMKLATYRHDVELTILMAGLLAQILRVDLEGAIREAARE